MTTPKDWHIFCRVIDNFGDIGVCWRLAKQLTQEFACQVTLWVDDLNSFKALCPVVDPVAERQLIEAVQICHWPADFPDTRPGQVVIEAFACDLPSRYIQAMSTQRPLWLNLEYLSAEAWVRDYHLSQSPVHGLRKTFFFPGFEQGTGGLLWDQDLLQLSQAHDPQGWRERLQLPPARPDELTLSLFAYENAGLPALLNDLSHGARPTTILIPEGRVQTGVERWLDQPLRPYQAVQRGNLRLIGLRFLQQSDYDLLLALCDLNFVRGEDSFVRCQMLGRPFLWHIYPQQDDAHQVKLAAFLSLYTAALPDSLSASINSAHHLWNHSLGYQSTGWNDLLDQLPSWQKHASQWRQQQCALGNLASNIVQFCNNQV